MNFTEFTLGIDVPNRKQTSQEENGSLPRIHNAKLDGFTDPCLGESWPSPRKVKIILPSYQQKAIVAAQGSDHAMSCVLC